jgi:helicase
MITKVTDQHVLVPTSKYPYAKFHFDTFNPVQSRIVEAYDKDINYVVASCTSSGKTACAELFMAYEVRKRGNKAIYLSPQRSLAQEKINDWMKKDHHFGDLKIAICTGDYKMTQARKKEMEEADIIVMTSEMLNSKCRNFKSEQNHFLQQVKTLVSDEFHILTEEGRGDHIESGMMKFTSINPDCRLICLSATMPNVAEIGEWLGVLNKRQTYVLESEYRPCPLNVHYRRYWDVAFGYDENEKAKVAEAIRIYEEHSNDKFLMFVHTKRTGDMLLEALTELGIACSFHNADQPLEKRLDIEKRFREDPKLRVIVATSTMAAGVNLPARRVIVLGIHRGLKEVKTYQIMQECGRAGRPQYDPCGDAYILLPRRTFDKHKARLEHPELIKSQMLDSKCLAFHLTSEIHHREIQSDQDIYDWYDRSLAQHQDNTLDEGVVNKVVSGLSTCGAVVVDEGTYDVTSIGKVASMFYFSPFDVSDLNRNFNKLFDREKQKNDYWLAMALANMESHRMAIASNADKDEMSKFKASMLDSGCDTVLAGAKGFTDGAIKIGCCYHNLLKGYNSAVFRATMIGLLADSERVCEVLGTLDQMIGRWRRPDFFRVLQLRLVYGVGEELIEIVQLRGIGKVKAKKLWDANIRSLEDVSTNVLGIIRALKCSKNVAEGISKNARELILTSN